VELTESLKRNEEEAKNLLESCKEMLQTNIAIYEDESLFQVVSWAMDSFMFHQAHPALPFYALQADHS
jgi:hypothetical protein